MYISSNVLKDMNLIMWNSFIGKRRRKFLRNQILFKIYGEDVYKADYNLETSPERHDEETC